MHNRQKTRLAKSKNDVCGPGGLINNNNAMTKRAIKAKKFLRQAALTR